MLGVGVGIGLGVCVGTTEGGGDGKGFSSGGIGLVVEVSEGTGEGTLGLDGGVSVDSGKAEIMGSGVGTGDTEAVEAGRTARFLQVRMPRISTSLAMSSTSVTSQPSSLYHYHLRQWRNTTT